MWMLPAPTATDPIAVFVIRDLLEMEQFVTVCLFMHPIQIQHIVCIIHFGQLKRSVFVAFSPIVTQIVSVHFRCWRVLVWFQSVWWQRRLHKQRRVLLVLVSARIFRKWNDLWWYVYSFPISKQLSFYVFTLLRFKQQAFGADGLTCEWTVNRRIVLN